MQYYLEKSTESGVLVLYRFVAYPDGVTISRYNNGELDPNHWIVVRVGWDYFVKPMNQQIPVKDARTIWNSLVDSGHKRLELEQHRRRTIQSC